MAAFAYIEAVRKRTGSERTAGEYARYLTRFLANVDDLRTVTAEAVHTFAYAPGPSGKPPSASTTKIGVKLPQSIPQ